MTDYIVDIDGTVADITHRRWYLEKHPKDWKSFNENMKYDETYDDIIYILNTLANDEESENQIILCTGRSEDDRLVTENWLNNNGIWFDELYMRKSGDYREDVIIKKELYYKMIEDGFDPKVVFEDRKKVVDMWRSLGLRCLSVCEGDY